MNSKRPFRSINAFVREFGDLLPDVSVVKRAKGTVSVKFTDPYTGEKVKIGGRPGQVLKRLRERPELTVWKEAERNAERVEIAPPTPKHGSYMEMLSAFWKEIPKRMYGTFTHTEAERAAIAEFKQIGSGARWKPKIRATGDNAYLPAKLMEMERIGSLEAGRRKLPVNSGALEFGEERLDLSYSLFDCLEAVENADRSVAVSYRDWESGRKVSFVRGSLEEAKEMLDSLVPEQAEKVRPKLKDRGLTLDERVYLLPEGMTRGPNGLSTLLLPHSAETSAAADRPQKIAYVYIDDDGSLRGEEDAILYKPEIDFRGLMKANGATTQFFVPRGTKLDESKPSTLESQMAYAINASKRDRPERWENEYAGVIFYIGNDEGKRQVRGFEVLKNAAKYLGKESEMGYVAASD